jgi:hypothetical protein
MLGALATQTGVPAIGMFSADYQPLDSDLSAIAALATTVFGRNLLTLADSAALRSSVGLYDRQAGDAETITFVGTPNASHTGDTATSVLATVTLPAGIMGKYGQVEVIANWAATGTAGNKTGRMLFGGVTSINSSVFGASALSCRSLGLIANNGSEAAQVCPASQILGGFGSAAVASQALAVDTTAPVNIVFDGTLTNAADTITLLSYMIRVHRRTA